MEWGHVSNVPAYWASWKLAPTANLRLGLFFEFFKFGGESGPARCKWLSLADDMQRFRPVAVLQSALPDREKPLQTLVDLAVGYGSRQRVAHQGKRRRPLSFVQLGLDQCFLHGRGDLLGVLAFLPTAMDFGQQLQPALPLLAFKQKVIPL